MIQGRDCGDEDDYGSEQPDWSTCHLCGASLNEPHSKDCPYTLLGQSIEAGIFES